MECAALSLITDCPHSPAQVQWSFDLNVRPFSEGEAAARGRDGAAEFFGGFNPFLNDDFDVGESFLVGLSVGGAAGKFGDFCDKGFVGLAPIDDDFVSRHRLLPPSGS